MSAAATVDETAPAPKKSKKLLFILIGAVVLALLGGGGALYVIKKNAAAAAAADGEEEMVADAHHDAPKTPPTFLPLDSMVVNLADPGGNRFVQMVVTLQLQDAKAGDDIKVYMPTIRNSILMLVSQLSSEQILLIQGKEKLAKDIVREISSIMGYELDEDHADSESEPGSRKKKSRRAPPNPLQGVLFSSFIVQ
jgi:flagellar protein FliL